MEYGIIVLSLVPLRAEATDRSEQVSQLLFGEVFSILERAEKWLRVRSEHDQYEGWLDHKQYVPIPESEFHLLGKERACSTQLVAYVLPVADITADQGVEVDHMLKGQGGEGNEEHKAVYLLKLPVHLLPGSILPRYNGHSIQILGQKYAVEGKSAGNSLTDGTEKELPDKAISASFPLSFSLFLGSPYQWGGRSPFGIDCSGLTQLYFRFLGISIPRDASQQGMLGRSISFLEESKPGDLAFFDNAEGSIVHVGVLVEPTKIFHASGWVRIDPIDHEGIFNKELGVYTHKLRTIRRIIKTA